MRILIVEDEKRIAASVKELLEEQAYAVDVVFDGEQGYEKALGEVYDLLILDLGLPNMDGVEICRQLRNEKVKTPILMLTARGGVEQKVAGLDAGADDYLPKPFAGEELLARVRSLLRRNNGESAGKIVIDSLVIEPHSMSVWRAGKLLSLTAKEFALLNYLAMNKGRVVNKQQIFDHCWDENLDPFSNVVDVYIGYLSKKIDKAFVDENSLITTIKGVGYKLNE
jgi:DNA-binding response OmpR family regulator